MEEFVIKQGRFEGPYTKLLELIESRKLSISEISLAAVADEYIAYTKTIEEENRGEISKFILVAATLMLIKAKSLLPNIQYTDEEAGQVEDLTKKLNLIRELREAEKLIKSKWNRNNIYGRDKTKYKDIVFAPSQNISIANFYSVAMLTLANMPNFEKLKNIAVQQSIRIEDVIERMVRHIKDSFSTLKEFAKSLGGDDKEKVKASLIVSFLALLEIMKQGGIDAEEVDGDIRIIKKEI